jgi:hypothetical protein
MNTGEWHSQVSGKVRSFKHVRPDFRNTLRSSENFTDGVTDIYWILLMALTAVIYTVKNEQLNLTLLLLSLGSIFWFVIT